MEPPTAEAIAGRPILRAGVMHIRTITIAGGGEILGYRPLEADGIHVPEFLSCAGGEGCMLLRGAQPIRPALRTEWGKRPVLSYWGYTVLNEHAEQFVAGTLPRTE